MPFSAQSFLAPIARSSLWEQPAGGLSGAGASPDVGFVEPMVRRRLSLLAKMTLRVAYDCTHDVSAVRIVFASRHGELVRTTTMLEGLAEKEALSPTLFGMSVLNASIGLFSILQKNTAPATAISAGRASFAYGLLEACLQLAEQPQQPVLLVYADEPPPTVYQVGDVPGSKAQAVGLLLDSSATTRVACSLLSTTAVASNEPQVQAFLRCLDQRRSEWHDAGRSWLWQRES